MSYPAAPTIILWGRWYEQLTRTGRDAPILVTPKLADGQDGQGFPNLVDLDEHTELKTGQWKTHPLWTGLWAVPLVPSARHQDDPDEEQQSAGLFGGWTLERGDEPDVLLEVLDNTPTIVATQEMVEALRVACAESDAAPIGVRVGDTIQAIWYRQAAVLTTNPPNPDGGYLSAGQTYDLIQTFRWRPHGPWSETTQYKPQDVVTHLGSSWLALVDTQGAEPVQNDDGIWLLVAEAGADGKSVSIVGRSATAADLPDTLGAADVGNGWITDDDGHLHVWTGVEFSDVGPVRGPRGDVGPLGPAGPAGPTGNAGAAGVQGPAGPIGNTGPVGTTGSAGPVGATGPAGAKGDTGTAGPAGAAGVTGPPGADGLDGVDGRSVTIVGTVPNAAALPTGLGVDDIASGWITDTDGHLHVWSGTAFTDVGPVRGPAGPAGPTGPVGPAGQTGPAGTQGVAGPTGATGTTGATGSTGPVGPQGSVGPAGPTGPTGLTGVVGSQGAVGPAGVQGPTGTTGAQGEIGPKGNTGSTGATGATGPAGTTGATGASGSIGLTGPAGATGSQGATGATGTTPGATALAITSGTATPDCSGGKGHHRITASPGANFSIAAATGSVDTQRWMIEVTPSADITITLAAGYALGGSGRTRTIPVRSGATALIFFMNLAGVLRLVSVDDGG